MIETLLELDGALLVWIQQTFVCDFLTPFFKAITHLGDRGMIWILLCLLLCLSKDTRKVGILALFALLFSYVVNNLFLKNLVERIRPYEVIPELERLIGIQHDFSFPSGHTGSSFAAAVVMYLKLPKKMGVPIMILAVLIAFSRMYLGVHYPTDVLSGALTGSIGAVFIVRLEEFWQKRKSQHKSETRSHGGQ